MNKQTFSKSAPTKFFDSRLHTIQTLTVFVKCIKRCMKKSRRTGQTREIFERITSQRMLQLNRDVDASEVMS